MALPNMRAGLTSREFLRIAGGYQAPALGKSPAGGLDVDNAGNIATDGDLTIDGAGSFGGDLAVTGDLNIAGSLRTSPDGVDKTWSHYVGAQEISPITAGAVTNHTFQSNRVVVPLMPFDASTIESACFTIGLPEDYDGSALKLTFYWTALAGTSGTVMWAANRSIFVDDETLVQDVGGATATDTFIAVNDLHIIEATDTPGDVTPGLLTFFVRRLAGSDTFDADAQLIGMRVTYA